MDLTKIPHVQLTIINSNMVYEDFQLQAHTRDSNESSETLLTRLKDNHVSINFISSERSASIISLFCKVFSSEEMRVIDAILPAGWTGRKVIMTDTNKTILKKSSSSSGGSASNDAFEVMSTDSTTAITTGGPPTLEVAVKQFLAAVLKLPQSQRADAIKRHLESPAYSSEYKQCLISMVRQLQNAARKDSGHASSANYRPPLARPPAPVSMPPAAPAATTVHATQPVARIPLWRGRIAFNLNAEFHFDATAFPIANPKGPTPQIIPPLPD